MTDNQIAAIIIAMLNSRYIVPGKDNEKTAKEIVDIYNILKEKTGNKNYEPEGYFPHSHAIGMADEPMDDMKF